MHIDIKQGETDARLHICTFSISSSWEIYSDIYGVNNIFRHIWRKYKDAWLSTLDHTDALIKQFNQAKPTLMAL